MPRITPLRLVAACALVTVLSLSIVASAAAKGLSADLRVVVAGGKVLAEKEVGARTTSVQTSAKAECFGKGSGGSGNSVSIRGNTGMGLLARASKSTRSLRPLLISDAFDFGLALCGVGGEVASGEGSWYLKINHKALAVGGDQAKFKRGDDVLWALVPSFPYPDELALVAPQRVRAGKAFTVRVFAYDEKGKRTPVEGAKVNGAKQRTGADGRTTVKLGKPRRLIARHGKDIPSARVAVCVGNKCVR
ncbi:MAG: hypothetical protein R2725_14055 [Solirubrobacterales bacterium]